MSPSLARDRRMLTDPILCGSCVCNHCCSYEQLTCAAAMLYLKVSIPFTPSSDFYILSVPWAFQRGKIDALYLVQHPIVLILDTLTNSESLQSRLTTRVN